MKVLALLLAVSNFKMSPALAWTDDFSTFNSTLWSQQTDIEHCNDGACFEARPDHLKYGSTGLIVELNQYPCNVTSGGCCEGAIKD